MRTTRQQASVWWPRAQLRRDVDFDLERRVSWLELFFDLVFVVVLSRLAHDLAVHPDADHVLDFVLSVADQVADYSRELGIDDNLLGTIEQFAVADRALAAVDFERNGYTAKWSDERSESLHTHAHLEHGWDAADDDPDLAERRRELDDLAPDTLGHHVHRFYRARGFNYPGTPGSAPPLLAQHDWVHVVAEYGTKVEAELEVFAFITRATTIPEGSPCLPW